MPNAQQVVLASVGMLAESLVEILKFRSRLNFSVPPHARQAAGRQSVAEVYLDFSKKKITEKFVN